MHTILILSAGTGSGHDSVAEAIAQEVAASPGLRPCIASPLGGAINGCYGWALNRAPRLWVPATTPRTVGQWQRCPRGSWPRRGVPAWPR